MIAPKWTLEWHPIPSTGLSSLKPLFDTFKCLSQSTSMIKANYYWLVVWKIFSHSVGNVIIPTDEVIFFRGVGWNHQPVKTNYYESIMINYYEYIMIIYYESIVIKTNYLVSWSLTLIKQLFPFAEASWNLSPGLKLPWRTAQKRKTGGRVEHLEMTKGNNEWSFPLVIWWWIY